MPFPLIPIALVGAGVVGGALLSGERNDAQVIVNPVTGNDTSLRNILLLSGAVVVTAIIVPKALGK